MVWFTHNLFSGLHSRLGRTMVLIVLILLTLAGSARLAAYTSTAAGRPAWRSGPILGAGLLPVVIDPAALVAISADTRPY